VHARAVFVQWARKLLAALEDELDEVAERIADAEARIAAEDGGYAHAADMTPEPTPDYGALTYCFLPLCDTLLRQPQHAALL
jgi:hypothetical protein